MIDKTDTTKYSLTIIAIFAGLEGEMGQSLTLIVEYQPHRIQTERIWVGQYSINFIFLTNGFYLNRIAENKRKNHDK